MRKLRRCYSDQREFKLHIHKYIDIPVDATMCLQIGTKQICPQGGQRMHPPRYVLTPEYYMPTTVRKTQTFPNLVN